MRSAVSLFRDVHCVSFRCQRIFSALPYFQLLCCHTSRGKHVGCGCAHTQPAQALAWRKAVQRGTSCIPGAIGHLLNVTERAMVSLAFD